MDIKSSKTYPSNALSNFSPHPFVIEDVECNSMEGFLQSLKFKSIEMQAHVCTLVGMKAKMKGKNKKWWKTQILYWKGKEINRHSQEYQNLLDNAYNAIYKNSKFKKALEATNESNLTHSIGKSDANRTILTVSEFCGRLLKLRDYGKL